MKIKIVAPPEYGTPKYETEGSAGMDLKSTEFASIPPLGRRLIKTGIFLELPVGYEAQIRPRSGLAYKEGITVLNAPGTIDSDYRGEIGVILFNASNKPFNVYKGSRIAQMVISTYHRAIWYQVDSPDELRETERADGGYGSTGH